MKKTLLMIIAGFVVTTGVCAQGYPVIDITSIFAAIENGYTMVRQLNAMYDNIKTSYDQLQQQIKNFESFDVNTLNMNDPLGSWRSINTYADRMMTYEENIEAILNKKDIKIGNASYSLTDMFTTPPTTMVSDMANNGINFITDPLETKLSPQEKAAFHQKYGMSYGHFMRYQYLGESLQKKASEVIGFSGGLQKNVEEDRERLDHIVENVFEAESTVKQQQMNNAIMAIMTQDIKTQAELLGKIAQQLSMNFMQEQLEKQAMQNEINMNSMDLAEGFLRMFEESSPPQDFK